MDNSTTDGSTDDLPVNVIKVPTETAFNHAWLCGTVSEQFNKLLKSYEYVFFAESDELLHWTGGPLNHLELTEPMYRFQGYEVVHHIDEELPLSPGPIMKNRKYWVRDKGYDKTLIANCDIGMRPGFHEADKSINLEPHPELYLIHLHRMDYDIALDKSKKNAKLKWHDPNSDSGAQNRIDSETVMQEYFRRLYGKLEIIPDSFKEII